MHECMMMIHGDYIHSLYGTFKVNSSGIMHECMMIHGDYGLHIH